MNDDDSIYWLHIQHDLQTIKSYHNSNKVKFDSNIIISLIINKNEKTIRFLYTIYGNDMISCSEICEYLYKTNKIHLIYWYFELLELPLMYYSNYVFISIGKILKNKFTKDDINFMRNFKYLIDNDQYINEFFNNVVQTNQSKYVID